MLAQLNQILAQYFIPFFFRFWIGVGGRKGAVIRGLRNPPHQLWTTTEYISVQVEMNETSFTPDNMYDSICEDKQASVIPDNTYDSMYEDK